HAVARVAHLPTRPGTRQRDDDGGRRGAAAHDVLSLGADETGGRTDRRSRRCGRDRRIAVDSWRARRRDPERRERRPRSDPRVACRRLTRARTLISKTGNDARHRAVTGAARGTTARRLPAQYTRAPSRTATTAP